MKTYVKKIIMENFLNWMKEIEYGKSPKQDEFKETHTKTHKMPKVKGKERILRTARETVS